jgi:hypothetical protein
MTVTVQETSLSSVPLLGMTQVTRLARFVLVVSMIAAAVAAGFATTGASSSLAISDAGFELTRLLRAMALIKAMAAVGASAAVLWRLGSPIRSLWFGAYALACCAMAAGPILIWNMVQIGLGALLLHGGLLATLLLLWRDPAVANRLAVIVAMRKAARMG